MRMPTDERAARTLLSTAQVAELFNVNVTTVNRWAKSGRLPVAVKVPGNTRANLYDPSDVRSLLSSTPGAA